MPMPGYVQPKQIVLKEIDSKDMKGWAAWKLVNRGGWRWLRNWCNHNLDQIKWIRERYELSEKQISHLEFIERYMRGISADAPIPFSSRDKMVETFVNEHERMVKYIQVYNKTWDD